MKPKGQFSACFADELKDQQGCPLERGDLLTRTDIGTCRSYFSEYATAGPLRPALVKRERQMLRSAYIMGRAALASSVFCAVADANADDSAADIYRGTTVTLYVGADAGGSYDLIARLISRHLGRHIPGTPAVIVVDMPGAGGIKMANFMYNSAPKDGSALGIMTQTMMLEQALGSPGVQFKALDFVYLGRLTSGTAISYTWHTSPTKSLEIARARETVMGGQNPATEGVIYPNTLNAVAGTKFRVITGYPGTAEMNVALERGEIEGTTKTWDAFKADNGEWLANSKVNILVQYGMKRAKDLSDVPLMLDLGRTSEDKAMLQVFSAGNEYGRTLMAPPEVPVERANALRSAFNRMLTDADFIADARARKVEIEPMGWDELARLVRSVLSTPSSVLATAGRTRAGQSR